MKPKNTYARKIGERFLILMIYVLFMTKEMVKLQRLRNVNYFDLIAWCTLFLNEPIQIVPQDVTAA